MTTIESNTGFDMIVNRIPDKKQADSAIKRNKESFLSDFNSQWESQMSGNLTFMNVDKNSQEDEQIKKKNFINEMNF